MNKTPLISIITPTFNAESNIESLILNIAGQTYKNVEHIIVDGLSYDATPKIVSYYRSKLDNITFIHEKDFGVYDAMNKGIKVSSGDYVYFLGSDDEFSDINVLMEIFSQGLFNSNSIIYGNVKICGNTGWAKDGDCYDGKFDLQKLLRKNICHQAIFYPREIFTRVGYFNTNYKINADWDFNLRCWSQHEFIHFDRTVANFKAGGASTGGLDTLFKEEFRNNILSYFEFDEISLDKHLSKSVWGDISICSKNRRFLKEKMLSTVRNVISNAKTLRFLGIGRKKL